MERTLVILKPDAVERKIIGEIITRFEKKALTVKEIKMTTIAREKAMEHYAHVKDMPFFSDMLEYITSGTVVIMVLEGDKAIQTVRNMIGKTSSFDSPPGTIRGDYGFHRFKNLIHASDSVENAEIEINRFL